MLSMSAATVSTPPTIAHVLRRSRHCQHARPSASPEGYVRSEKVCERLSRLVLHNKNGRDIVVEEHAWDEYQRVRPRNVHVSPNLEHR